MHIIDACIEYLCALKFKRRSTVRRVINRACISRILNTPHFISRKSPDKMQLYQKNVSHRRHACILYHILCSFDVHWDLSLSIQRNLWLTNEFRRIIISSLFLSSSSLAQLSYSYRIFLRSIQDTPKPQTSIKSIRAIFRSRCTFRFCKVPCADP